MNRVACVIGLCAVLAGVPSNGRSQGAPLSSPTPDPIVTVDVTSPPLGQSSSPGPSPTPSAPRHRRSRATPSRVATQTPTPVQSAEPEATPHPSPDATMPLPVRAVEPSPAAAPPYDLPDFPRYSSAPPLPTPKVTPVLPSTAVDRAYDLVGGKWTCRTFSGTSIAHYFARGEDALSLLVTTIIPVGDKTAKIHEIYRYHAYTARWSVSLANGQFIAVANQWISRDWTFTGIDSEAGVASQASMTFKRISPDSYSRTFLTTDAQGKTSKSGELCLRVGD